MYINLDAIIRQKSGDSFDTEKMRISSATKEICIEIVIQYVINNTYQNNENKCEFMKYKVSQKIGLLSPLKCAA